MADKRDLTGVWYGRYWCGRGLQDNSFIALIEDDGGSFDGSISEPDPGAGGILNATVQGQRTGNAVRFDKQYVGRWTHAVRYAGQVDEEGTAVNGVWQVEWERGTFTMEREIFRAEELEDEDEAELKDPVAR